MWTIPDTVGSDLPQVLVIAVFHEPPSATSARWWERWRSHLISRAEQNRLIGTTVDAASESNGCHLLVVGDDATTVHDLALSITYRAGINGTDVGSTLYTYAGKKTLAEVPAAPATGLARARRHNSFGDRERKNRSSVQFPAASGRPDDFGTPEHG